MKNLKKAFMLWTPVIIIVIALICSVCIYYVRNERYKDWVSVSGVITNVEQYVSSNRTRHNIYYSYNVNGAEYTGEESFMGNNNGHYSGEICDIWYDPDNITDSRFEKPGPGLNIFAPFFLGIPLAVGMYGFNKQRSAWNYRTPTSINRI